MGPHDLHGSGNDHDQPTDEIHQPATAGFRPSGGLTPIVVPPPSAGRPQHDPLVRSVGAEPILDLAVANEPVIDLAALERAVDQLTARFEHQESEVLDTAPSDGSIEELAASVCRLTESHEQAISAVTEQSFALHRAVEELTRALAETRQELQDTAQRRQHEIHDLRRQLVDLRSAVEDRISSSGQDHLDELQAIRRSIEEVAASISTGPSTATELATTINTLRGADLEEISAAHLVHSLQGDMRALRAELAELKAEPKQGASQPRPTSTPSQRPAPPAHTATPLTGRPSARWFTGSTDTV